MPLGCRAPFHGGAQWRAFRTMDSHLVQTGQQRNERRSSLWQKTPVQGLQAESLLPAEEIVAWPLLEGLRIFPRGATEVFTAPVIGLGRAIIALVSGDLPEAPPGKNWFMELRLVARRSEYI